MMEQFTFPSGLRIFSKQDKKTRLCAIWIGIGACSRYEGKNETGISHFVEHMLFKGTEKRSAKRISVEFDSLGAKFNAYTSHNQTCLYAGGLAEHIDAFADLLSDAVFHSTFKEEEIEREKRVVCSEIAMYEDDPEEVCLENLCALHYGKHPKGKPVLGTEESVNGMTREMLLDYVSRTYLPENIVVSYTGPDSAEKIRKIAEERIERELVGKAGKFEKRRDAAIRTGQNASRDAEKIDSGLHQANVAVGFRARCATEKKRMVIRRISTMLGGNSGSRLFQTLREKTGLAYSAYCEPEFSGKDAMLIVFFASAPQAAPTAMRELRKMFDELIAEGFAREELEIEKNKAITECARRAEDKYCEGRRAISLCLGDIKQRSLEALLKKRISSTLDEINAEMRALFDIPSALVSYVGPEQKTNLGDIFRGSAGRAARAEEGESGSRTGSRRAERGTRLNRCENRDGRDR